MRARFFAPLLLLALCVPGAARAEGHALHEIEAGGFIGGRFFSGSNEIGRYDLDPRSPDNAPQHTGMVGLGLSYAPHPRIAIEAELGLLPTTTRSGGATVVLLAYRAHALVHLLTGRLRPFLLLGAGATSLVSSTDRAEIATDTDGHFHGGAGLKLDLPRSLVLRLEGRVLLPPRIEDSLVTADFEVLLGLGGRFSLRRPGSRVPRPSAAGALDGSSFGRKEARRPPPPIDGDGDGVLGAADRCPAEPEDRDGFADEDGCPDPDNDGDGVLDRDDRCPDQAGPAALGGCPKAKEATEGRDPAPPAAAPDPDTDGDGIADKDDRCPAKPETKNGFSDEDGCPDAVPKDLARLGALGAGIGFAPGKPLFLRPTLGALKVVARLLQAHPAVRLSILVAAADGQDPAGLAAERAGLLRLYLTEQGADGARITAAGGPPLGPGPRGPAGRLVTLRLAQP